MSSLIQTYLSHKFYKKPRKWLIFTSLYYTLENSVRKLIADVLSEKHGVDWWEKTVPEGIKNNVKALQKEEKDTPVSIRSEDNLSYTDFGELIGIFDHNWKDFGDMLRSQKSVRVTFSQFNNIRNVIAHSCELNDDEIQRFKLLINDWLRIQQKE